MDQEYINSLKNYEIAVLGFGVEGKSLCNFFFSNEVKNVTIFDVKNISNEYNFKFNKVSSYKKEELSKFNIVFTSPGISPYTNDLLELNLSSLTDLWFNMHPNAKVIGVTGSKGKSTTASLICHVLKSLNQKVVLAGNIGIPLLDIKNPETLDFVVVELSSYQLFNFSQKVDSACFLNLYEEHLSWHKGFENYKNDKLNLCRKVNNFIVANEEFKALFSNFDKQPNYFNLENNENKLPIEFAKECTQTLLKLYGFNKDKINQAIESFKGLEHRLCMLKELNDNIKVIDDSLSTIPESAIKACLAYKNQDIYLILGGKDRGINYNKIKELPSNVVKAFCFDEAGEKMYKILEKKASFYSNFSKAIKAAVANAKKDSVILFSPAAPSNSPFSNYKERSEYLEKTINDIYSK